MTYEQCMTIVDAIKELTASINLASESIGEAINQASINEFVIETALNKITKAIEYK